MAYSNAACDEIATRLLDVVQANELLRLYAKSFKKEKVPPKLIPFCNLVDEDFVLPSLEYIYRYRVLVCTVNTSGILVLGRGENPIFKADHFKRVFLDEAGCVPEPASLVPIAGIFHCS